MIKAKEEQKTTELKNKEEIVKELKERQTSLNKREGELTHKHVELQNEDSLLNVLLLPAKY